MLVFNSLFKIKKNTNPDVNIDIDGINLANVPQHIAIIMDGNGRWAKAQGKVRTFGHQAGAETLKTIVKIADKIGVKVISAYAFSTENWKRPVTEVSFIMELLSRYLTSEIEEFNRNNVQVRYFKLGNKLRWAGRNFTGNTAYCGRYRKRLAESRRYTGRNF